MLLKPKQKQTKLRHVPATKCEQVDVTRGGSCKNRQSRTKGECNLNFFGSLMQHVDPIGSSSPQY
eukprot:459790-Amphidinium_carterae.1